ncbi:MAG TPA: YihY/virulence factor BrkB family protein [Bacteroidales bacterium]|nr:YihY/virulence factor BrkB family protein [Bacteroidales bacterium]
MNSALQDYTFKILNRRFKGLTERMRKVHFPGGGGLSVYEVVTLYIKGLMKGSLNIRATSIAFHFMLALGPAVIFLLGLIPYLPFTKFQVDLMDILQNIIPDNSYAVFNSILHEIFDKHHGLQIFGFLVTLFFIQKGLNGIIEAFNASYHTTVTTRSWFERRLISVSLFFIFFILGTIAAIILFMSNMAIKNLYATGVIKVHATVVILFFGKWLVVLAMTFLAISFLYFMAPAHKVKWRLFTPGSAFATLLSIVTSMIVSYFINHFAPFNRFFGSIGTLIAVMLWMNFNAIALLAGFELNACIKNAQYSKLEPSVI